MTTIAQFTSRCGLCDLTIHEGDEIVEIDGEWVHVECGHDEGYTDED